MTGIAFGLVLSLSACLMPTRVVSFPTSTPGSEETFPTETQPVLATVTAAPPTALPEPTQTATVPPSPTATATVTVATTAAPVEISTAALPTETPQPSATAAELLVRARMDTNCREGPGPSYEIVGSLRAGDTAALVGRSSPSGWWYIENPSFQGFYCWVWGYTTEAQGDTGSLPYVKAPEE
ncbi:MAG TPA: hypothetical protein VHO48_02435 [Anaerolineaceae bacterium]|nr:hypothetical protein [Anaerolineaceae bacterium]